MNKKKEKPKGFILAVTSEPECAESTMPVHPPVVFSAKFTNAAENQSSKSDSVPEPSAANPKAAAVEPHKQHRMKNSRCCNTEH